MLVQSKGHMAVYGVRSHVKRELAGLSGPHSACCSTCRRSQW